jgi:polyisoprenoid-binding protein YceI
MLPSRFRAVRFALLIAAPSPESLVQYDLEPDQVLVTYQVPMGKHQLSGVSTQLDWTVTSMPDGSAQVQLSVPVPSFSSGHPQIDEALTRALGEQASIEVAGIAKPGSGPVHFDGTVTMHGKAQPFHTTLHLTRLGSRLAVRTSFAIDLDSFGIARPAEFGAKVDVEFAARLRVHPRAVISGGSAHSIRTTSLN